MLSSSRQHEQGKKVNLTPLTWEQLPHPEAAQVTTNLTSYSGK
jgi:hypothetical protein